MGRRRRHDCEGGCAARADSLPHKSDLNVAGPATPISRPGVVVMDRQELPAAAVLRARVSVWPLLSGSLVLVTAIALLSRNIVAMTGGAFAYTLDDAYIHLATARTLLEHGVWGATASAPASVSSSPAWVVLLALAGWAGVPLDFAPALLAAGAGVLLVYVVDAVWREQQVDAAVRAIALPGVVLVAPVPGLVLMGMEHVLHAALCVAFWLELQRDRRSRHATLLALAAVLPLVRFESLLLILALTLAYRRSL